MKKIVLIVVSIILCIFICASCNSKNDVLDISSFSDTMVYSTVDNMLNSNTKDYLGKTIIIKGVFVRGMNNYTNEPLNFIVVTDNTACCSLGLEFETAKALNFPSEYPSENENVKIKGVFEQYEENGTYYCHLVNTEFI